MIANIMMLWVLSATMSTGHELPFQKEGACFSMFSYEYYVVQKLLHLEGNEEKKEQTIQTQKDQIAAANKRLDQLAETLQGQADLLTAANKQIKEVTQTQREQASLAEERQREMVQTLQEQSEQLKTLGQMLVEQAERHEHNLSTMEQAHKEQLAAVEKRLGELKRLSETQAKQIVNMSSRKGKQVAFSVFVLNAEMTNNEPTWSRTAVNTGSFDMSTGKFTCPIAGQYYFSLHLERNRKNSGNAYCYFHVNGVGDINVMARGSRYEAASGSIIQHLSVNDVFSIRCLGWEYMEKGRFNAMFSGFLISQD